MAFVLKWGQLSKWSLLPIILLHSKYYEISSLPTLSVVAIYTYIDAFQLFSNFLSLSNQLLFHFFVGRAFLLERKQLFDDAFEQPASCTMKFYKMKMSWKYIHYFEFYKYILYWFWYLVEELIKF